MDQFLACYGYGQGGVWVFIRANARADIEAEYPELTLVETPPAWLVARVLPLLDLEHPSGLLQDLLDQR
jgi:hypothetical protein